MSWFKTDDQWLDQAKVQAAGLHGRALWHAAGTKSAPNDGHVAAPMVRLYAAMAECNQAKAVKALVAAGLWHDEHTIKDCPRCYRGVGHDDGWEGTGDLDPGSFYFHDWREYQLDSRGKKDQLARKREARRSQLRRNPELRAAVRERDRDLCRYCGVLTMWSADGDDRPENRADNAGTYDHVDPFGDNSMANLVVACRRCNTKVKKDRTPEQAGMTLRPAPGRSRTTPNANSTAPRDRGLSAVATGESDDSTADRPRVARDSGPTADAGPVGPRSERDEAGGAGEGRAGAGSGLSGEPESAPDEDLDGGGERGGGP